MWEISFCGFHQISRRIEIVSVVRDEVNYNRHAEQKHFADDIKLEIPEEYTQNTLSSSTWGSEDVMRESYSVFKTLCTLEITEN